MLAINNLKFSEEYLLTLLQEKITFLLESNFFNPKCSCTTMTFCSNILRILVLTSSLGFSLLNAQVSEEPGNEDIPKVGISENPAAIDLIVGTGEFGKAMGIPEKSGVRLGGSYIADYNYLFAGGVNPHKGGGTSSLQLDLSFNTETAHWWKGGLFKIDFLQFNGTRINFEAGEVQGGYNSLPGLPPLDRSEIYELWYRQTFFNRKLVIRIGKMVTSYDFTNVLRPFPLKDLTLVVPANSGVIYTAIFTNPSMLGVLPGFYNSACGIVFTYAPVESAYCSYGAYDGNMARGKQTGLRGPQFNGYYFHIAEMGYGWTGGASKMPGSIGLDAWYQSGKLTATNGVTERGIGGVFLFGSQRLWKMRPGVDNSGMVGFYQAGINNSKTLPCKKYLGGGLTFFSLIKSRKDDSFGCGFVWSKLNKNDYKRSNELMTQAYYQFYIYDSVYLTTALTYIPNPGAKRHLKPAYAGTARVLALF